MGLEQHEDEYMTTTTKADKVYRNMKNIQEFSVLLG